EQADVLEGARDFRLLGDAKIVQPLQRDLAAALMRQPHRATGWPVEAGDAIEHRGLAGAVWSDQRGDLAAARGEGEVVDRDDTAEAHGQVIDGEDVVAAHPCPSLTRSDEIACDCFKYTVGARWPMMPRGRQIISSTMARPNTSMRYCSSPRN